MPKAKRPEPVTPESTPLPPLKVLVAEDEPDTLTLTAKKLAAAGFEVLTASDGRDAWNQIVDALPDVVVLDITMPGMDGLSILREMRAAPPTGKYQAVVIVSAHNQLEDMQKGVDLQADHYLTKPCSAEDIISAIRLIAAVKPLKVKW